MKKKKQRFLTWGHTLPVSSQDKHINEVIELGQNDNE